MGVEQTWKGAVQCECNWEDECEVHMRDDKKEECSLAQLGRCFAYFESSTDYLEVVKQFFKNLHIFVIWMPGFMVDPDLATCGENDTTYSAFNNTF